MEYYPHTKAAIVGCFFCLYKLGESQFISEIVGESPIKSEKVRSTYYRCCTFVARIAKKSSFNQNRTIMNQTKTAVIISIVCVVMLGVLIFLNRDKFSTKTPVPAEPVQE